MQSLEGRNLLNRYADKIGLVIKPLASGPDVIGVLTKKELTSLANLRGLTTVANDMRRRFFQDAGMSTTQMGYQSQFQALAYDRLDISEPLSPFASLWWLESLPKRSWKYYLLPGFKTGGNVSLFLRQEAWASFSENRRRQIDELHLQALPILSRNWLALENQRLAKVAGRAQILNIPSEIGDYLRQRSLRLVERISASSPLAQDFATSVQAAQLTLAKILV